jgi:hypothetical protein
MGASGVLEHEITIRKTWLSYHNCSGGVNFSKNFYSSNVIVGACNDRKTG